MVKLKTDNDLNFYILEWIFKKLKKNGVRSCAKKDSAKLTLPLNYPDHIYDLVKWDYL